MVSWAESNDNRDERIGFSVTKLTGGFCGVMGPEVLLVWVEDNLGVST